MADIACVKQRDALMRCEIEAEQRGEDGKQACKSRYNRLMLCVGSAKCPDAKAEFKKCFARQAKDKLVDCSSEVNKLITCGEKAEEEAAKQARSKEWLSRNYRFLWTAGEFRTEEQQARVEDAERVCFEFKQDLAECLNEHPLKSNADHPNDCPKKCKLHLGASWMYYQTMRFCVTFRLIAARSDARHSIDDNMSSHASLQQ